MKTITRCLAVVVALFALTTVSATTPSAVKDFTYEPKAGAAPSGWITSFSSNNEPFRTSGEFRIGPKGECVSVVSSGRHPWYALASKSNYTMALYADISQVAHDKTGRFLLALGGTSSLGHGLLVNADGTVKLYQANSGSIQHQVSSQDAVSAGYHLFVWTQSTTAGGTLYVDGVKVGTLPAMTSATATGFQLGSLYEGCWTNYGQAIGMAVAGVYGWGQVLTDEQVAQLAEEYPATEGGAAATSVPSDITGTLNLVSGDTIPGGAYGCSIAITYGATVNVVYAGEIAEGAEILSASAISAEGATILVNGQMLPSGLEFDVSGGRLVVSKSKVTKLLNPLAVKEGDAIKVLSNDESAAGEAAKAYDGNASTYFAPGDAADNAGVSWAGIAFTNDVIVTRIAYSSATPRRMIGGAFQGANAADFSDAENLYVVEAKPSGMVDVTLDEAKGPYRYLRFIGMYGGNVSEIRFYGLADSGSAAPTGTPRITGTSVEGVAQLELTADGAIPQVYVVQRAMASFCDDSDYETFVTLAPQPGETMTWTDRKPTLYAKYRAKGVNAKGSSGWTYFSIVPERLIDGPAAPTFAGQKPGFYADQAVVEITYGNPQAKIYYTTDGSTPTTNSTPYTGAITLTDACGRENPLSQIRANPTNITGNDYKWNAPNGDMPNVNIIRARAFLPDGSASKNDVAGTWMIGPTANAHKLRVISLQTDYDNYFSDATGILVPGDIFKKNGFGSHSVGMPNANYFQSGDDWERPTQLEIFDTDGKEMLSAEIGTRVRGFWSRAAAKKSLTCYFRKEYGTKNAKLALFGDEGKKKFKRFILRNGGNDWYKFGYRDALGQAMFRGYVSTGTQGFEPGVLYINGEYWGLYNMRHCYSKHHFEEWNGGAGDDIDYIKLTPEDGTHFELQEGDFNAMWNIMRYMIAVTSDGVMDDGEYARVEDEVDIADMIDYHVMNIFLGNNDWMGNGNNMGLWRNRTGEERKWHFTVYDCDSAMSYNGDSYTTDHIQAARNANDTDDGKTKMAPGFFKRCFMNEGFKRRFANRYADLLNTALRSERTTDIVARTATKVEHELARNVNRWTNIGSVESWSNQLATVIKFFNNRPSYAFQHIKNHCSAGDFASLTLAECEGEGTVKINTIESGKAFALPFTGKYFSNIPVTLTATPAQGSEFAGWKIDGTVVSKEATIELMPTNGVTVQAMFSEAAKSGEIVLTGEYPDGTNIVLSANATVVVSNATFGAALAFTSNFVATVRLPADTSSTAKSIASEGRIILQGEGGLSVSNNATLVTCGGLTIEGGTLDLELNDDSGKTMVAAEMRGSYIQNGGAVNLRMHCTGGAKKEKSAYGFRWKDRPNCVAELNGGTFGATMHSDYQSVAFKANDVSNKVLFGGAEVTGEFTGVDGRLASTDGEIAIKSGSKVVVNSSATGSRVFKSDTFIRLRKAKVTVHARGAGSEIFSCDDTIDAGHDNMVLVLESTDDCFSAQTNIIVSAGVVYGISTENDVLDSNGQMTISGGTVLAYALTPGHEGLDTECAPDNGLDHTLTISGGTVVALGGTGSAWPTNVVFTQRVYTNLSCSATAFSRKYLSMDGEFAKTTVKLPTIADEFILLATMPAMTGDPTAGEDAPSVEPIAANIPAWVETKSPQQFVRFHSIYGNTTAGSEEAGTLGDVGEYIVLTNLSSDLTVDLTGLKINVEKLDDWTKKGESGSKCLITLTGGTIAPRGSMRLDQATYWGGAKQKITNGDLYIALTDSTGALVQNGYTSNDLYPECDGNGAALVAKTFGKTMAMTTSDWKPSFAWFVFAIDESGATITGIGETLADETTLTLPTELGKVPVVAIADGALVDCANLRYLAFKGTPLMCSSAAFPTGVIGSFDATQAGWDEAIVDGRWNGLIMLNGAEETISVNIAAGYPVSGTEKHGLFGVKGDQWLNVVGTWNSETTKTIGAGAVTAVSNGVSVARTNVVIKAAAKNSYTYNAANQETFFKGYLDDGGNRARITVSNVPYSKYDVIVYGTSDTADRKLSPVTVNGVTYTWAGETTVGSSIWGATQGLQPQLGRNALWILNQTAMTLKIVGGANANSGRGGIAAIQIVNRGKIDEDEPSKDFHGTMTEDATLETVSWENGPFEAGRKNTATLTMTGEGERKLTLSDPLVALKSLTITGENALWLSSEAYPKNIATLDLEGVTGLITYGWPVKTLESSTQKIAYAGGAGTAEAPVVLNPKGGTLWLRGGTYSIANGSWSGTSTTVDIDDSVLDFGSYIFGIGTATYTIGGTSEVTAASFVLSQGGNSRTSVFTMKDDAVLNVTGSTIVDKNTSSIMFGHWNGPTTFTLTNNAVFNAPKAEVLVGKTGNAQTINIAGGVFEAYGIKASANASGNNRLNLSGGELKLGAGGISTYKAERTIVVSVRDEAQITATDDMTIDQPINVAEGVTLALGSENGATFIVGADTFADASAGRIEVTKGNVKLSGEGVLGEQTLKIDEGATVTIALADYGEITAEGVTPFKVETGDTEIFTRVVISDGAQHPYVKFDADPKSPTFGKLRYQAPTCELKGLHIAEICAKPTEKDPNGRESGWVELVNYGPETVNLKDYKLYRLNYGKKDKSADAKKMLDREVQPGERTLVYMSEDYETAEDYGGDGATIKNFGDIMVIPTKINPKKYPSVTLYDANDKVIDKVVVPCELDDDGSVLVGITTNRIERFVTFTPTKLAEKDFSTALAIGPEVNGLFGKKDYKNDLESLNKHKGFAPADMPYTVRLPINPVCESTLKADGIKSVRLIYRVFDPAGSEVKSVAMKSSKATADEESMWGKKSGIWEGEIPAEDMIAGKLVQYAVMITDGAGAEWRAPRFVYPELGYEWYGVVVDPGESVRTDKLQTFLFFIDNTNKAQMDTDADKQTLPYCARTAVYDTQTHTYYDNVRIDLRGNTSKNFTKKSHGLRFNKVAPLICIDPTTGDEIEVRKTSFISEFADPTYMRQMLSFWMLRDAGCRVPFDYPARLYLNGAYYQLAFHSVRFSDDMIENVYGLNKHVYSYKNIGTFGGGTSAGGIEKKTPDDDNESDLALLNAYCKRFNAAKNGASLTDAQKAALDKTVVTNFDVAAWINYIAATRISSECDDVWANLSGYIDQYDAFYNSKGDNMMYPLAYDMNLSWGQHYRDGGMGQTGLKADKDWFKSHPFYGGFVIRAHASDGGSAVGSANYAYETILQNPERRALLVRRLRTLMDKYLGAPGTPKEETPLWQRMQYYADLIADDAATDREKWKIDSTANVINNWPTFPASLEAGLEDLWTNYLVPRREHLYVTHSATNTAKAFGYGANLNAGIPLAQALPTDLKGVVDIVNLGDDGLFHDEEVLVLTNKSTVAIDMSGWQLQYSVSCTFPGGAVIPAQGCLYVPADRRSFVGGLVADGIVTDQIVLPSATFKITGEIALVADDGTEIVKYDEPTVVPVQPGEAQEMKAKTEEEAQEEISKYEVKLTDEDKAAGVDPDTLTMVPVGVSNETTGVVAYYAIVAVNPLTVEPPGVGGGIPAGETEPISPISIGEETSEGRAVSIGIVNAAMGLWYGYEVSDVPGANFANDIKSFKRAAGATVKITGSPRKASKGFFRVKVLPAKPAE